VGQFEIASPFAWSKRGRETLSCARVVGVSPVRRAADAYRSRSRIFTPARRHIFHLSCSDLTSYNKPFSLAVSTLSTVRICPRVVVSMLTTLGVTGSNLSNCGGSLLVVAPHQISFTQTTIQKPHCPQPLHHEFGLSFEVAILG
jgi:hypothetical protein